MAQIPPEADRPFALQARYVFPVVGPPIPNGLVTVRAGRIVAVGTSMTEAPVCDLGNVALMPGLINAHTHLELSTIATPLGNRGMSFTAWIREVIRHRQEQPDFAAGAVTLGIAESVRHGVTTIVDIAQSWWLGEREDLPLDVVALRELIAPRRERISAARLVAQQFLDESSPVADVAVGLSPHAPYTVHWELLDEIVRTSRIRSLPLAMHLAETREEIEFLKTGRGSFRELLGELDAWDAEIRGPARRPLEYLELLSNSHRALIVHGNYLDNVEIAFVADRADRMAVVYCPRTHAYFGHDAYPLHEMLAAGVRIALGTDSRASNPDLSILAEMRYVAECQSGLAPRAVMELGTIGGAAAIGRQDELGCLRPGYIANLTAVELPNHDAEDPYELVLGGTGQVVGSWFQGQQAPREPMPF